MRISINQLRRIIKEEVSRLYETGQEPPDSSRMPPDSGRLSLSPDLTSRIASSAGWKGPAQKTARKKGRRVKVWYPDDGDWEWKALNPIVGTIFYDECEGVDKLMPEDPNVIEALRDMDYDIGEDGDGLYADPEMVPGIIIKDIL